MCIIFLAFSQSVLHEVEPCTKEFSDTKVSALQETASSFHYGTTGGKHCVINQWAARNVKPVVPAIYYLVFCVSLDCTSQHEDLWPDLMYAF